MSKIAILKSAVRSLWRTFLRSSLTALGIVIGVAAIIVMAALGSGAKAQIEETLARPELDHIVAMARVPVSEWPSGVQPKDSRDSSITLRDYARIRSEVRGISLITPRAFLSAIAKSGRHRIEARVIGWGASGLALHARKVLDGTAFGEFDVRRSASVCLITETLNRKVFVNEDPIGKSILVNGTPFLIIGVVEDDKSFPSSNREGDASVIVPVTSLLRRLAPDAPMDVAMKPSDSSDIARLKYDVQNLLERFRGNRRIEFNVFHQLEGFEQSAETSRTMTFLLSSIAGVALLVGGIGIMNIMLVNVTERTREIGIRLAVGTRDRDVLTQFLVEAVILSSIGGMFGILSGVVAARLLTYLNGWPTQITSFSILAAVLCSTCVGVFFGYYPARRAARMNPIQALRTE